MTETLVELTPARLAAARRHAADADLDLVPAISQLEGWTEEQALNAVAAALGIARLRDPQWLGANPLFDRLPFAQCSERRVAVLQGASGHPCLVLTDPFDAETEAWALRRSGLDRQPHRICVGSAAALSAFLAHHQAAQRALEAAGPTGTAGDEAGSARVVLTLASIAAQASPVVRFVDSAIHDAFQMGASDIHFESDATLLRLLYRIDGVLAPAAQLAGREQADQAISRIKVMADLDIAERRVPQDGRFKVGVNGEELDLRVSVMPSLFGEDAVLRLLDRRTLSKEGAALRLDDLGLSADSMQAIRRLAHLSHGMVLVTGPTGSGKTTTLYSTLTEARTGREKIVTIEDPIEYRLAGVLQIPVNEKKGLTFARGLRSILRHDPDKIMVGEIRDGETATIAVQAALTGHLVFTTVHANNVFDVFWRFLHMGVDAHSFASALQGIVAQRLLRTNCTECAVDAPLPEDDLAMAGLTASEATGWRLRTGVGCAACRGTGYRGRRAVAEVLCLDDEMRELIAARAPLSALKAHAEALGLRPMREAALACVAKGDTTLTEVLRVFG